MLYIVHIATTFQSFLRQAPEIQELIFTRVQQENRIKNPGHPILNATLDQYLTRQAQEIPTICHALKRRMALSPEFGHVIAIARGITENGNPPKVRVAIARTPKGEKNLLESFWMKLGHLIKQRGTPTFVTWNGLEFTFPFIIERSAALGIRPTHVLPRARFHPYKHLDLMAELSNYDPHRYLSLKNRLTLWGSTLNGTKQNASLQQAETVIDQWRKGDLEPLKNNLTITVHGINEILQKAAPYLVAENNNHQ